MNKEQDFQKPVIGVVEAIDLPELSLPKIKTRIDTGAKTSALHVDHIKVSKDRKQVSFEFHPDFHDLERTVKCKAPVHARRWIKSSNGEREKRYVIEAKASVGKHTWTIQLTLTDRSNMTHLMLLGREALKPMFIVDPSAKFLLSEG